MTRSKPSRRASAAVAATAMLCWGLTAPQIAVAGSPSSSSKPSSSKPKPSSSSSKPSASSSSESSSGSPQQKGACIDKRQPLAHVKNGVSHAQAQLDFTSLWDLSKGDGVTVGVIDSGVTSGAFGNRLSGGGDLVAPQSNSNGLVDCDGHGTLVAGIIGASPDHKTGFSGVAPESRLVSIRQSSALYTGKDGKDVAGDEGTLAKAIGVAVDKGARVINISTDSCGPAAQDDNPALRAALTDAVEKKNVVVVVAAGNVGSQSCTNQNVPGQAPVTKAQPADLPDALTVAALSDSGQASQFSLAGPWVKVAAPGEGIISANPQYGRGGQVATVLTDNGPTNIAGTSFAAPYVTGLVALVRARFPHLSAQQVMHRIEVTADHVGQAREDSVGFGPINPRRALTAVLPEEGPAGHPATLAAQETTIAPPRHEPEDVLMRSLAGTVAGLVTLGLVMGLGILATRRRRERLAARRTPRTRAVRRRGRRQRIPSA